MKQNVIRTFLKSIEILEKRERRRLIVITGIQSLLGLLDLIGVALMAVIGALTIRGVQSQNPGNRVEWILSHLHLSAYSFQRQVAILSLMSVTFLILKTVLSIYFSRKILFFLAHRSAEISSNLVAKTLSGELEDIFGKSTLEIQYAIGPGVNYIGLGIIGVGTVVISDVVLLGILGLGLLILDSFTFITISLLFAIIGFALYKLLHTRARRVGAEMADFSIKSNQLLNESLFAFREIFVRNRQEYFAENISKLKLGYSRASAEQAFLPNVSKYIIEISVTLGAVIVAGVQFSLQDASHAVASLALFIAAGSRIAPALLRIQQGLMQIQGNIGNSQPTFDLIHALKDKNPEKKLTPVEGSDNFEGRVTFEGVSFKYRNSEKIVINNVSLDIKQGEFLAIAGESGSGKSTLIDLMLGLLEPSSGSISISGLPPRSIIELNPNAISYVPQNVSVFEDSIARNIALGFDTEEIAQIRVLESLDLAQLRSFVDGLPDGVNEVLSERGNNLSGGQLQRIGIARALYNRPKLLILDEATSALDGKTESEITEMIMKLKGTMTLVVVAHRLSTIRSADRVILLEDGSIKAEGSFEHLRATIPTFEEQASLMGL